ncbi:Lrp/AsnC family transcriptional regulator [Streptomyces pristinaespiralis]|uniref:AsnC-family transcriptional regulator n=2 Tax=Streptomyces pristinaespiralis TaxID=38300 RepID=B5H9Q5_STRE2|nr:AsnC family transcriptional regulator [Streptomyces pristinaespiralis]ALC24109.1 AsnC family transcriptional regulator [Streptomyces pristinaespiralis]EDY63566.1 AsnC-family transcriptional regulator [Streptomyces pristinaespiralis ATCC 25486]QMU13504.1 AsnC family transcriptional regulator [Streptomyces pristinaespiralis]
MDSATLDVIDLRLLHALQLDGRAAFSRIADVLGVSDRTVARRFSRLRRTGTARVAGVTSSHRVGHAEWLVRLRALPPAVAPLAHALARRPDTAWVTVASSGTEVICIFRVAGEGPAPLGALGRLPQVTQVDAQRLLRPVMSHRWIGRTSALSDEQITALRPAVTTENAPVALTDLDHRLLPALAADGRAAYPELARHVGWSESAVRRRLDELRRSGVLQFDVEVDSGLFGFFVQCLLWLTVVPARLDGIARTLAGDPEAAFVGSTTGPHNLIAIAVCRDAGALHTYLTDRIGSLEGVDRVETVMITSYTKRAAPAM